MNKEIEEAIKDCEEIIKSNNTVIKEARKNGDINVMQLTASLDRESKAIETVLNYIKELEEENKNLKDTNLMDVYLKGVYDGKEQAIADSTPNSVIREKIKELEKGLKATAEGKLGLYTPSEFIYQIKVLEEILKEGEK